jgi:hypothetical protein
MFAGYLNKAKLTIEV